jgi:hypothetical protein
VGCAANSRRTARARSRRFRTHRVALPARPAAETVTDLAHIYRESLGPVRIQHANVVTRRAGDDLVDALPRTDQPVSSDWLRGSRPCALLSRHVSVRTPGLGSPCTQDLESLLTITAGEFIDRHGKLLCHRGVLWVIRSRAASVVADAGAGGGRPDAAARARSRCAMPRETPQRSTSG